MSTELAEQSRTALAGQRAIWHRQSASFPQLRGGKRVWFPLVLKLVDLVASGGAHTMDTPPKISLGSMGNEHQEKGGPDVTPSTWSDYSRFLRGLGLARMDSGVLRLTEEGESFKAAPTGLTLGTLMADRIRLFAECLEFLTRGAATVDEIDAFIRLRYDSPWKSLGGVRDRLDWFDALGLAEGAGNRRWRATDAGRQILDGRTFVSPEAIAIPLADDRTILPAPIEIQVVLDGLFNGERSHDSRSTYNIWVPSPAEQPNKVENLRTILNAALDPIEREELLSFIAFSFALRRSSVDSMMPFMRASGLLEEIGLGVYQATDAARAWLDSNDDVNFVRLLHGNMRFVGEMLKAAEFSSTRANVYREAARYGLNVDKSRWIMAFLLDTQLIEQPRYGSVRATAAGTALARELPLANAPATEASNVPGVEDEATQPAPATRMEDLSILSRTPQAFDNGSGRSFELAIRDAFLSMGFSARTVSGPGDTDVLVRWRDNSDSEVVAVIEAKSRSNGQIAHTDISDVAIETHVGLHSATHAAIVGPSFTGDTIKNMAERRGWALITASQLGALAQASSELGLGPDVMGLLFSVPDGLAALEEQLEQRRRELSIITFVLAQLGSEAEDAGDELSARDIFRDGRRTELAPSIEEVSDALALISRTAPEAIRVHQPEKAESPTYFLGNARTAGSRLRAIARAIDSGIGNDRTA